MSDDSIKEEYLLPERHPQHDLFICDVGDAVLKDDMASMEHPFFSLSKTPEYNERLYQNGDKWLKVVPSEKGLATIYDKDILIYAISQLIAKMKNGEEPKRKLKITAKDLLVFINRSTSGRDYERLIDALDRLDGTRIRTNVKTGGMETREGFGLIEGYRVVRSETSNRIIDMEVTLSEWSYNAVRAHEVLTLNRYYFRLRKPIERRVYEIARKHCGQQEEWRIGFEKLQKKCGSRSSMKEFRRAVRDLVKGDHLPDYVVHIDGENVVFRNREVWWQNEQARSEAPTLDTETYNDARIVAPGYDPHWLYQEWIDMWIASGKQPIKDVDKAFLGFCRKRHQMKPAA
jgi:plasmid replication initiation protein